MGERAMHAGLPRLPGPVIGALLLLGMGAVPGYASPVTWSALSYDNALLSQFKLSTTGSLPRRSGTTGGTVSAPASAGINPSSGPSPTRRTGAASRDINAMKTSLGAVTVFASLVTPGSAHSPRTFGAATGDAKGWPGGSGLLTIASKTTVNPAIAAVFPFGTADQVDAGSLSSGLAGLPGTPGVATQTLKVGNGVFFTASNDDSIGGRKYGAPTAADLRRQINPAGVNDDDAEKPAAVATGGGDGLTYTLPNLNSYAASGKPIFDFVDARSLVSTSRQIESILAPLAPLASRGGKVDGAAIVNAINQSQALYAANLFTGRLIGVAP